MGHCIRAVIGSTRAIRRLGELADVHASVELPQGFHMVFTTDAWLDALDARAGRVGGTPMSELPFLTTALHDVLRPASEADPVVYLETEYFGGMGSQGAVAYDRGRVLLGPLHHDDACEGRMPERGGPIHRALVGIGVRVGSAYDAFDALGLGRFREMDG